MFQHSRYPFKLLISKTILATLVIHSSYPKSLLQQLHSDPHASYLKSLQQLHVYHCSMLQCISFYTNYNPLIFHQSENTVATHPFQHSCSVLHIRKQSLIFLLTRPLQHPFLQGNTLFHSSYHS